MRNNIPEKLLNIIEEIENTGQADLTRLTVLKNWFASPHRLARQLSVNLVTQDKKLLKEFPETALSLDVSAFRFISRFGFAVFGNSGVEIIDVDSKLFGHLSHRLIGFNS